VGTTQEFAKYVRIALCSKEELEYQLTLVRDLGYIKQDQWKQLADELAEIGRMLYALFKKLR
jgi:four helix bundle protein